MSDLKELDEKLTEDLVKAVYGYHCIVSNKAYSEEDALNEYLGKWDNPYALKHPHLRNIVNALKGMIYRDMEYKNLKKDNADK